MKISIMHNDIPPVVWCGRSKNFFIHCSSKRSLKNILLPLNQNILPNAHAIEPVDEEQEGVDMPRSIIAVPDNVDAAWIIGGLALKGMTRADLAKKMKIPQSTLNWKVSHTDKLTQADVKLLSKYIGTKRELAEALMKGE